MLWDVFISHASEDKDSAARPLADRLASHGLRVWYDETSLELGDSLLNKIDEGLSASRFGIVVLSKAFFDKNWTRRELDGLVAREMSGKKVILPIWHNIDLDTILQRSPSLAGKMAVNSSVGWDRVTQEVLRVTGSSVNSLRFRTIKERKSPNLCLSYIAADVDTEFSSIEFQFAENTKRRLSLESTVLFVRKMCEPVMAIMELLSDTSAGLARSGRVIEGNPTYTGYEKSRNFRVPVQGIKFTQKEWTAAEFDILLRCGPLREIDFGFVDTIITFRKVSKEDRRDHNYVPELRNENVDKNLKELLPKLSTHLGKIAATCLEDTAGSALLEEPIWLEEGRIGGSDGYLVRGMLL